MNEISWDTYFMSLVYLISMRSKDQSTNIGAVIVGSNNEIRSTGYNSFPRGIDDFVKERQERPEKYYWFSHAEKNAIDNAAMIGVSVKDCIMYTQGIPCMNCALSVVQSGIKEVIVHKQWEHTMVEMWAQHAERTKQLFKESNVKIREFNGPIVNQIYGFCRSKKVNLN